MRQPGLILAGTVTAIVVISRYFQVSQLSYERMALDLLLWGGGTFAGLFFWFFVLEFLLAQRPNRPMRPSPKTMESRREDLEKIEGEIPPEEPIPTTETFMGMSSDQLAGLVTEISHEDEKKEEHPEQ